MSREFVMGARINMTDGFSSPVSRMSQTTRQFGDAARNSSHFVDGMGRSAMASTSGLGAFTAGSRAANLSARGLAGGVATLTASMLGLNSIMGIVMGLMTFKVAYDWLVQSNSEMEQYQNTLTVVLKSILQFVERQGKVIAVVNGKEVEVPNVSGQPDVKIGENGELRFSTSSTTKIDVTEMANAQARLIANQELEKQAKINAEEMKKEKSSRKKERIEWILSATAGAYLLTR